MLNGPDPHILMLVIIIWPANLSRIFPFKYNWRNRT